MKKNKKSKKTVDKYFSSHDYVYDEENFFVFISDAPAFAAWVDDMVLYIKDGKMQKSYEELYAEFKKLKNKQ